MNGFNSIDASAVHSGLAAFIAASLQDPDTSWSVGEYGALAEFHLAKSACVSSGRAVQEDGAISVNSDGVKAIAYEIPSGRPGLWQHGVALCAPEAQASVGSRAVVTDLGNDAGVLLDDEQEHRLFDLGLGLKTAAFCVRTSDRRLARKLEMACGHRFLEVKDLYDQLVEASPTRVLLSKVGRIEVRSRVPRRGEMSPESSHTHLLPALLDATRRHSALLPIPRGWQPCMFLYPANALQDRWGRPRAFDSFTHSTFQDLLIRFGDRDHLVAKHRVLEAIAAAKDPELFDLEHWTRTGRMAARVTVRQLLAQGCKSTAVDRWLSKCEPKGASFRVGHRAASE